jgi:hypothetical protein
MSIQLKPREKVASFINAQLKDLSEEMFVRKGRKHHYGIQELRDLLDFLYESKPTKESEYISLTQKIK